MKRFVLIHIVTVLTYAAQAQITVKKDSNAIQFAETITAADLKEYLTVLASDEYEGRETGEKGQKMAAEYIAKHFSEFGLTPIDANKNYLQEFTLISLTFKSAKINDGKLFEDFNFYGLENIDIKNANFAFVGFGINSPNYNNYEGIDATGKVVLFLEGEPISNGKSIITNSQELSEWSAGSSKKIETAKAEGAIACVLISSQTQEQFSLMSSRLNHYYESSNLINKDAKRNARLSITEKFALKMMNISSKKFGKIKSKLNKVANAHQKIKPSKITIELVVDEEEVSTENVVGMIQGTDLADEAIVISAHYDHIGIKNGSIYNGADDDGSGTVAIMEIAEAFAEAKKNSYGPRRNIIFLATTGEEKGLLGSQYYVENPLFPLEKTVTNLNIDMIGRLDEEHRDNKNYIYLIGTNMISQDLHDISHEVNKTYKNIELDYKFNSPEDKNRFYYRSDHYNFAKNGIPVIFYFNGVHDDYHKSTDTVDKILFDKVENITQLIFYTTWEIANRDEKPKISNK